MSMKGHSEDSEGKVNRLEKVVKEMEEEVKRLREEVRKKEEVVIGVNGEKERLN